ncbi:MAG: DnaJ domain-containing protein [Alphaproteobacteria bacterium]|nr:DnaJ domain-containing protein [Alphaproteobacteria bacterium]
MRDPYEILGVQRNASAAAIKSAYRKLAKKHHPDSNKNDPRAAARFAEINSANEILGDEAKRKQFDRGEIDAEGKPRYQGFSSDGGRGRAGGFESQTFRSGGAFEDILNSMFGGGMRSTRSSSHHFDFDRGGMAPDFDMNVSISVSLEEAVRGAEKRIRLPSGRELNVTIPANAVNGQQIRMRGQGQAAPGHPPGDLVLTIAVAPHPIFKIDGADLRVDLPITLYDAVLGGRVRVPTLGKAVELTIPRNTSSGRTLRVKGKGLPRGNSAGDLFVTMRIVLPEEGDDELDLLMRRWRERRPYNPGGGGGSSGTGSNSGGGFY